MLGTPGWRMGEAIGVLTEKEGRPRSFTALGEIGWRDPGEAGMLRSFRADLQSRSLQPILISKGNASRP